MSEAIPLRVEALVKHYGSVKAVDGITFDVGPGELVGFIGPNGAGKTTTYRCIVGLQRPDMGRITIGGIDVHQQRVSALRLLGYVGQDLDSFRYLTGEEMLRMVGELYELPTDVLDERVAHFLERFELQTAANRLVKQYSGGMARKLSIAAALLGRPPLLLLDESFAGLDPEATTAIREELDALRAAGTAVLLSSHVLDMLERWASRVIVLSRGKIAADLTREELDEVLAEYGTLTDYYLATTAK
jgi:ABC-2 type transport system ATP-binding protein